MEPIKRPLLVKAETLNIRFENQPRGSFCTGGRRGVDFSSQQEDIKGGLKRDRLFRKLLLEVADAVEVGRDAAVHKLSGRQSGSRWWATDGGKEEKHRAAVIKRRRCARVHHFKTAEIQSSVMRVQPSASQGRTCRHRHDIQPMNFTLLPIPQACVFTRRSRMEQCNTPSAAPQKMS